MGEPQSVLREPLEPPSQPYLFYVRDNRKVYINCPKFSVGRGLNNTYVIEDLKISRCHCVFEDQNGRWYLHDVSTNGTWVDGRRIEPDTPHLLTGGDQIQLSDTHKFVFIDVGRNSLNDADVNRTMDEIEYQIPDYNREMLNEDDSLIIIPDPKDPSKIFFQTYVVDPDRPIQRNRPRHDQTQMHPRDLDSNGELYVDALYRGYGYRSRFSIQDDDGPEIRQARLARLRREDRTGIYSEPPPHLNPWGPWPNNEMDDEPQYVNPYTENTQLRKTDSSTMDQDPPHSNSTNAEEAQTTTVDEKPATASVDEKPVNATVDGEPQNASVDEKPVNATVDGEPQNASVDEKPVNATVDGESQKESVDEEPQCSNAAGDQAGQSSEEPPTKKAANALEQAENELQCIICTELFVKATTLNCSHSFCRSCLGEWRRKSNKCPICRAKITTANPTLVLDNFISKMLESASSDVRLHREELLKSRAAADVRKPIVKRTARHMTRTRVGPPIVLLSSDDDSSEDVEVDDEDFMDYVQANSDRNYNGVPGAYYGGYGHCFLCGERGHWANGCPYRV